jgi:hypothetical protein
MCGGGGDFTGIPFVDDIIPNEIKDPINEVKQGITDLIPDPIKQTIDDITPNELKTPEGQLFMKFVLPEISDLTGGDLLFTNTDIPFDGPTITDMPFDGPTLPTDVGIPNIPTDSFDGPTLPTDTAFDGPTPTNTTDNGWSDTNRPDDFNYNYDTTKNWTPEDLANDIAIKKGLNFSDALNVAKTLLSGGSDAVKKIIGGGAGLLSNINSEDVSKFFSNLGAASPLLGATGLGYLTYKGRQGTNKSIMDAYNNYLGKQSGINTAYGVGQGPQTLNYNVAGVPLAQAQPRTAAQTVVMPKAARGGSINDLYNEYSELNNRMRNYRRLAKGGLI